MWLALCFNLSGMLPVYKKLTRRTRISVLIALIGYRRGDYHLAVLSIPIRSDTLKAKVIALLTDELESEVTIGPSRAGSSHACRSAARAW